MECRKALFRFVLVSCSLLLSFLLLEIFLRYGTDLLPTNLQNILESKYNRRPDGIYYRNDKWQINIMKPNLKREIFYNRQRWLHQSNDISIRSNGDIEKAEIVALGDSFTYGHGVEIENTLCHYLESISRKSVANLGVQGDYPVSEYIRLKNLALFLKPTTVLFFINFPQDCSDFLINRPKREYVNRIISAPAPDYALPVHTSDYLKGYPKYRTRLSDHLSQWSYSVRLLTGMLRSYWAGHLSRLKTTTDRISAERMIDDYMAKVLSSAHDLCELNNVRLFVIFQANSKHDRAKWDVFVKNEFGSNIDFNAMCKKICERNAIPFLDLQDRSPKEDYFLKGDNHYSPEGNKWAAESIYHELS